MIIKIKTLIGLIKEIDIDGIFEVQMILDRNCKPWRKTPIDIFVDECKKDSNGVLTHITNKDGNLKIVDGRIENGKLNITYIP